MALNSLYFLLFLSFVSFLILKVSNKNSIFLICIANIFFYMYGGAEFIYILLLIIVFSYFSALFIEYQKERKKPYFIFLIIVLSISALLIFKYYNFAVRIINTLLSIIGFTPFLTPHELLWPLGISFYTFTALGYILDVSLSKYKANKNFFSHFAFVGFFTTISSGPILRFNDFQKELIKEKTFNFDRISQGFLRIFIGSFKKLVIADNIGKIVDSIYSSTTPLYSSPILLIAILLYAVQIYSDFSGYSDMAIGASKVIGFDITENFKRPYLAKNYADFWSRWHISLTTWFRDYIFIPLSFTFPKLGLFSIFIIYPISGLWHGAGSTFIIWGALNGLFMILDKQTAKKRRKFNKINPIYKNETIKHFIQSLIVFLLFSVTLIFFRFRDSNIANSVFLGMFNNWSSLFDFSYLSNSFAIIGLNFTTTISTITFILLLLINDLIEEKKQKNICEIISTLPAYKKIVLIYLLAIIFMIFANTGTSSYIYYQF